MYSPMPGPNGTVENRLKVTSLPEYQPAPAQAASTEPCETASIACAGGTSAPGSKNCSSISPPDARAIFWLSSVAFSPISTKLPGNVLVMLRRSFGCCE